MKKKNVITGLGIFLVVLTIGCNTYENNSNSNTPVAALLFGNISPDTTKDINASFNGSIISNVPYNTFTNYATTASGALSVKAAVSTSSTLIVDTTFTTEDGKYYSVFAVDSISKLKMAFINDPLVVPGADSTMVRFLDFSPNAPAIDFAITGGAKVAELRTFNDQAANTGYTAFNRVKAGTYNFEIRAANSTMVLATAPNVQLLGGKIYTFIAKGLVGGAGSTKLTIGNIRHN